MVARVNIASLPTPVEELPRLTSLMKGPRFWVKRDDLTGLAFGGNKARKLEFLVAEALAAHADTLVTAGAIQSNHCRQTAAAAARFGLHCELVLTGIKPEQSSANLYLDELLGAGTTWVADRSDRDATLAQTFQRLEADGKQPYLIPYGGSSPTGALGYVHAMQELMAQGGQFDWIVVASSSGGTQAGLVCGAKRYGFKGKILGISIDEPQAALQAHVLELANQSASLEGMTAAITPADVLVNDEYCSAGYGVLTDLERNAVRVLARNEGLLLDPVYTGRAAGGMLDLIKKGFFSGNDRVLFWHTGGQPALFASAYTGMI